MAIRTLLLTDVVDSTRLGEQLGDAAMAALWARHDRVARDLLVAHGGREIDKTDGFLLIFDDVAQGLAYANAYHTAIGALGLQARAGLHVGDVILTENRPSDVARGAKPIEVDGSAKPYAARVDGARDRRADARDRGGHPRSRGRRRLPRTLAPERALPAGRALRGW